MDVSGKIGSVCQELLILATKILTIPKKTSKTETKETTEKKEEKKEERTVYPIVKMNDVDENVCTSIIFSILNSDSTFYRQCLHSDYISLIRPSNDQLHMSNWRRKLNKNSKLDCMDFQNYWYSCTVLKLNGKTNQVLVSYDDWGNKWDEWITRDNPRLQPHLSVSQGGKKACRVQRLMEGVVKENFVKYELDSESNLINDKNKNKENNENDENCKDNKKFGVFRGLLSPNISFRIVEAINVFGQHNGFELLLQRLKQMNDVRNVRCIAKAMEKVCRSPCFYVV